MGGKAAPASYCVRFWLQPILMLTPSAKEKEVGGQLPAGFVARG